MKNFLIVFLCLFGFKIFSVPLPIVRNYVTTNAINSGSVGQVLALQASGLIGWVDQTVATNNAIFTGFTGFKGPTTNLVQNIATGGIIDFSLGNEFRGTLLISSNLFITNMFFGQFGKVVLTNSGTFQTTFFFNNGAAYLIEGITNSPPNQEYFVTIQKTLAGYMVQYPNILTYITASGNGSLLTNLVYVDSTWTANANSTNFVWNLGLAEQSIIATGDVRIVAYINQLSGGSKQFPGFYLTNTTAGDIFLDFTNTILALNTFTNRIPSHKQVRISGEDRGVSLIITGVVQP